MTKTIAIVFLSLLVSSTAFADASTDACKDKQAGEVCTFNDESGKCEAQDNNCNGPLTNGKCVQCIIPEPVTQERNPTITQQRTPDHSSSVFCTLGDGSIGQTHYNYNNCGGDLGPCTYCAAVDCSAAKVGKTCDVSIAPTDSICTKNEIACPVGSPRPCFICADDREALQDPEDEGCLSSSVHKKSPIAPAFMVFLALLFGWRRVRRR